MSVIYTMLNILKNKPVRVKSRKAIIPQETIIKIKNILHENRIDTLEIDTSESNKIFFLL